MVSPWATKRALFKGRYRATQARTTFVQEGDLDRILKKQLKPNVILIE
jgi:hypothetical protein